MAKVFSFKFNCGHLNIEVHHSNLLLKTAIFETKFHWGLLTNAMPAFSSDKPHFFQPLIPGFEDKFFIPVSFFKYLKGLECHEITLRSSGGKLWPIKVKGRQFTDGWKEFVQDHDLHIGDFVVFRHQGNLIFDFIVFDESSCEREYTYPFPSEDEETENEEETEIQQENVPISTSTGKKGGASSCETKHPYSNCVIKLSRDSFKQGRLYIPREFTRENGLHCRSYSIILKDEESHCWKAKLICWSVVNRFLIGAGWRGFCIDHELKEGDSVMVELIEKGEVPVFQVHTLK